MTDLIRRFVRQPLIWLVTVLYLWAWSADAQKAGASLLAGMGLFVSVSLLIIAVFSLVGLIQVWIGRETIGRTLGHDGGVKGLLLAVGCGAILIGPPYVIFPLLMSLRRLGARWAVVAIVLAAYALKPQMIPVEAEFLGLPFTLVRAALTLLLAVPLGLMVEWLMPDDVAPNLPTTEVSPRG